MCNLCWIPPSLLLICIIFSYDKPIQLGHIFLKSLHEASYSLPEINLTPTPSESPFIYRRKGGKIRSRARSKFLLFDHFLPIMKMIIYFLGALFLEVCAALYERNHHLFFTFNSILDLPNSSELNR